MRVSSNFLKNFETEIADLFNKAKIKAPIHLSDGNEEKLIKIFKEKKIKKNDWIFCSWRSHYHCLLKGVKASKIKKAIMDGKSISLCFLNERVYSSAIVSGSIPIAVGMAMSLKLEKSKSKVYCFIGDMTAETGIMHECYKYSVNHNLPIHFIIEDNDLSVCTPTKKIWGISNSTYKKNNKFVSYYKYKSKYPHAGAGIRVQF